MQHEKPGLWQGKVKSVQLPRWLNLCELEQLFGDLRRHAFEDGNEWGGCVMWKEGSLTMPHPVRGWPDGVTPICTPKQHTRYVGFVHVHPPIGNPARPYMGFSDQDFRATLADGDHVALVTNGPEVFALVRCADCTLSARAIDDEEFARWEKLYADALAQAEQEMIASGVDTLDRQLWEVNRTLCERLGFAFYRGLWGQPLKRIFQPTRRSL